MKEFHGEAAEVAAAPQEDCFALLAAVDAYPGWCPDVVRHVEVQDRDAGGQPSRARMRVRIARGPLVKEFELLLAVGVDPPDAVNLSRFNDHPTDQEFNANWVLRPAGSTRIGLELDAKLRVPGYIPTGGKGNEIAENFVTAACPALARTR